MRFRKGRSARDGIVTIQHFTEKPLKTHIIVPYIFEEFEQAYLTIISSIV